MAPPAPTLAETEPPEKGDPALNSLPYKCYVSAGGCAKISTRGPLAP
jgi:hypothetical protein